MTHLTAHEWNSVGIGTGNRQFTRAQSDALHDAACAHPLAQGDGARGGGNILAYGRDRLIAQQMVGVIATGGGEGGGCSLEILPKVDPDSPDEDAPSVRARLVAMLDFAIGLKLDLGNHAAMARKADTLLEMLARAFADKLLAEVRRGLPRRYMSCEDDLPALRGRLDVVRQFTRHAVRPDRLACRFDELSADTPLMRIMAAAVTALRKYARNTETQRRLDELAHAFGAVTPVPAARLPWKQVRIDRTNRRWQSLFDLAKLLLSADHQQTHHGGAATPGITLLFPMNDLFEAYVTALMRRALNGSGIEVKSQGGLRYCLGDWPQKGVCTGSVFQTKPDIILRRGSDVVAIIDTKWKKLAGDPLAKKHGVSQADVYQMMAYARLYDCRDLMLLYPASPGEPCGLRKAFGIAGGSERLRAATIDVSLDGKAIIAALEALLSDVKQPDF